MQILFFLLIMEKENNKIKEHLDPPNFKKQTVGNPNLRMVRQRISWNAVGNYFPLYDLLLQWKAPKISIESCFCQFYENRTSKLVICACRTMNNDKIGYS